MTILGGNYNNNSLTFNLFSKNAEMVKIYFYDMPQNEDHKYEAELKQKYKNSPYWSVTINLDTLKSKGIDTSKEHIYYGYRCWGSNWNYDVDWKQGNNEGYKEDVDKDGNRFNPNKLLMDPYAKEISHDPSINLTNYSSGDKYRNIDTGKIAPKSIVFLREEVPYDYSKDTKPSRALRDDIIYEVHIKGFTALDRTIDEKIRGTYAGAAQKADYLKELGVTAIEFLPLQEFSDEQNDTGDTVDDNYWGYMPNAYFAPNRRYSSDKTPGGPTREFKEMVEEFHKKGIKVFIDVVYNHTGEGQGVPDKEVENDPNYKILLSYAGLDNASYYQLHPNDKKQYQNNSGCGGNLNYDEFVARNLVIDSLKYWKDNLGVDGFRFDLAPVLGSTYKNMEYEFTSDKLLTRISDELSRIVDPINGVDLIAEPWLGKDFLKYWDGNFNKFPEGFSGWSSDYKNTMLKAENKLNYIYLQKEDIYNQIKSSFGNSKPWRIINYIVSHDEYNCLSNPFRYNDFWHLGNTKTGECKADNIYWDHNQDENLQQKAIRNMFTLLMLSAGIPMFCGGDEFFRTLPNMQQLVNDKVILDYKCCKDNCNRNDVCGKDKGFVGISNLYSIDNKYNYINWTLKDTNDNLFNYVKNILQFRNQNNCLRPKNELKADQVSVPIEEYQTDDNTFLGVRIFANEGKYTSIFMGYNRNSNKSTIILPAAQAGKEWFVKFNTAINDKNYYEDNSLLQISNDRYTLEERSILVCVEK